MKPIIAFLIIISCFSALAQENVARSRKIFLKIQPTDDDKPVVTLQDLGLKNIPKQHALIIGISEYENRGPNLTDLEKPIHDAQRLYSVLTTKYHFDSSNVTFLKNPTFQKLSDELNTISDRIEDEQSLLIFYAGHGYYDKSKELGFWLPSDARMDSRAQWVSNTSIRDNLGSIKQAKHILVITDACFGGSIFKGGGRSAYEANLRKQFIESYRYRSRKGITSGNLSEVPDQSIFIETLIRKLEENTDPFITAFALFNRIYEPILNNSHVIPQYGVVQGWGDEGGGDFVFFKRDQK